MSPIDHERAAELRAVIERALPELEYVVRRWQGSQPRSARQIEIPGVEDPDPIADDAWVTMVEAVDELARALVCDDYMLSNAGPSTRARAAVACQCSLVMHDQRESEGRL